MRGSASVQSEQARVRARPPNGWRGALLTQGALVLGLFTLYEGLRLAIARDIEARGLSNAMAVMDFEASTFMNFEGSVQAAIGAHEWLMAFLSSFYVWTHFFVTAGLLVVLLLRNYDAYRHARNLLVGVTGMGFLMHWLYPLAPPRLVPASGLQDSLASGGSGFHYGEGLLSNLLNEYAAMPSLHVAWAFVVAVVATPLLWTWARPFALAYPATMVVAVIATGNHWVLDAMVGAALVPISAVMATAVGRAWHGRASLRRTASEPPTGADPEAGAGLSWGSQRKD